jgi:hypothetical protein
LAAKGRWWQLDKGTRGAAHSAWRAEGSLAFAHASPTGGVENRDLALHGCGRTQVRQAGRMARWGQQAESNGARELAGQRMVAVESWQPMTGFARGRNTRERIEPSPRLLSQGCGRGSPRGRVQAPES